MSGDNFQNKIKGTFVVRVNRNENATWQGNVTWVEERKQLMFRSVLELIKLIDGALECVEQEQEDAEENSE
ncbi:MAG: hypothetical protein Q4F29_14200 [Lachnospiraceae bacterium]|nr:hypothetical protein [Lachnospiraceae bacterium]